MKKKFYECVYLNWFSNFSFNNLGWLWFNNSFIIFNETFTLWFRYFAILNFNFFKRNLRSSSLFNNLLRNDLLKAKTWKRWLSIVRIRLTLVGFFCSITTSCSATRGRGRRRTVRIVSVISGCVKGAAGGGGITTGGGGGGGGGGAGASWWWWCSWTITGCGWGITCAWTIGCARTTTALGAGMCCWP